MFNKLNILSLLIISLLILSCSREDPNPIQPPPLIPVTAKINEIYSRGDTSNPDWIEIYNPSTSSIDLSGYKIYDIGGQSGSKPKKSFPSGTIIPANGFFVIIVDDTTPSGFGLSSSGEQVWLENASGSVIDNVTFPALDVNQSYIRYPDGAVNWFKTDSVTRGSANVLKTNLAIKINEIYSNGNSNNPDWIELYNILITQVDLSGYKIYDIDGKNGTKPKMEITNGTSISGNGFLALTVDNGSASGFDLSINGETIWLEDANGIIIDSVIFPALGPDTSYGRKPDGTDNWSKISPPTKGSTNVVLMNVLMNEIYSRGTTSDPDWIEIYNPNNIAISLTGYKIYDIGGQSGSKPKKEFPSGATIAAKGFYVIVTDDGTASAFGLSSTGETVWLENPSGVVIDNVAFPAMDVTQSYSRIPDGSSNWQLTNTITRGGPNQ